MRRLPAILVAMVLGAMGCGEQNPDPAYQEPILDGDQVVGDGPTGTAAAIDLPGTVSYQSTTSLGDGPLDLIAKEYWFDATYVRARPGATVTVRLENAGNVVHTFTIDDLGIDVTVNTGEVAEIAVPLPEEGTVRYYCAYHDVNGMQGAFFFEGRS